jgi:hypothetical protein
LNTILKSIFAAGLFASFSMNAAAEDIATKDTAPAGQASESRKEMREHVKSRTTPEERNAMHQKVTENMANKSAKEHDKHASEHRKEIREHVKSRTTPEERNAMHQKVTDNMAKRSAKEHEKQASEHRKEMREHVKNRTTPEERKEMHKKVKENMDSKSGDRDNSKPATQPAN